MCRTQLQQQDWRHRITVMRPPFQILTSVLAAAALACQHQPQVEPMRLLPEPATSASPSDSSRALCSRSWEERSRAKAHASELDYDSAAKMLDKVAETCADPVQPNEAESAREEAARYRELAKLWAMFDKDPSAGARDLVRALFGTESRHTSSGTEVRTVFWRLIQADAEFRDSMNRLFPAAPRIVSNNSTVPEVVASALEAALLQRSRELGIPIIAGGSNGTLSVAVEAINQGTIMSTSLLSLRVETAGKLLDRDGNTVIGWTASGAVGHINELTGFIRAATDAGIEIPDNVVKGLLIWRYGP